MMFFNSSSNLFIESEECANVIKNEILSVIQKILPITKTKVVSKVTKKVSKSKIIKKK